MRERRYLEEKETAKYPWGPIEFTLSQGTFNSISLVILLYLAVICYLVTMRTNRKEFMPRHFGFKGLHQHHFIYSCHGLSSLENHKSFIIYRFCIATYWTSGWIYGVVTSSDYACAYYEYFSNWVDTVLLIYFLYQLGLILFEYRSMQNLVNNDLEEIVKHPSWKTLRGVVMSNNELLIPNASWYHYIAQFLFEISCLMTFLSTGLIYTLLYDSASQSPQTNFHRLHQFIFSFCLITFELFWTSIPIRIYHVIYCWPIIGLYSGILYWNNEDEEKLSKFPLFTSSGQSDANIHDVALLCIVTFVITTGVYLLLFSCSLCKWSCIANTQTGKRHLESDVTPHYKTRDSIHQELIQNDDSRIKYFQLIARMALNRGKDYQLDLAPRKHSVLDVARVVSARDRLDRIGPTPDLEMTMNTPMAPSLSDIALNKIRNDMHSLPVELPALNRAATQA